MKDDMRITNANMRQAFVLHFLAEAFQYPDESWIERFRTLAEDAQREGMILPSFSAEELREEHFRLFGPSPACPQDLTLHLAENPFEQARMMAHMAGFYRAFGVEQEEGERSDNLPVALSFLFFLILKERNAALKGLKEAREVTAQAITDFTQEFLSPGVAAFSSKLVALTLNPFYLALAEILGRGIFAIPMPLKETISLWEPRSQNAEEGEMTCGILKQPLQS